MAKRRNDLPASYVREILSYDAETGVFTWRKPTNTATRIGDVAGGTHPDGYRVISIGGLKYSEHRLAYLWMTGEWPSDDVDHVDGNRANNAWDNLRACTCAENAQNLARPRTNSSGAIGVTWNKSCKKWQSSIRRLGKSHYLGLFDTVEEAAQAYLSAKSALHTFQKAPRSFASVNTYQAGGGKRGMTKLAADVVVEIFKASGRQVDIAKRYGTNQSMVSSIKRRAAWAHITEGLAA